MMLPPMEELAGEFDEGNQLERVVIVNGATGKQVGEARRNDYEEIGDHFVSHWFCSWNDPSEEADSEHFQVIAGPKEHIKETWEETGEAARNHERSVAGW